MYRGDKWSLEHASRLLCFLIGKHLSDYLMQIQEHLSKAVPHCVNGLQEKEMKKFPTKAPRINRPPGMTADFIEAMGDGQDYEDDEELTATERARSSLQRRGLKAEEEVSEGTDFPSTSCQIQVMILRTFESRSICPNSRGGGCILPITLSTSFLR